MCEWFAQTAFFLAVAVSQCLRSAHHVARRLAEARAFALPSIAAVVLGHDTTDNSHTELELAD